MNIPSKQAILLTALLLFWGLSLFYVAIHALPYNPLVQSKATEINLKFIMPEGWSFFTKNPREDRMRLYRVMGGGLREVDRRNATAENMWGLSRYNRLKNIELGQLVPALTEEDWTELDNQHDLSQALDSLTSIPLINEARDPHLCGSYCLVKYEPLPWAWSQDMSEKEMPAQIVKLDIVCL